MNIHDQDLIDDAKEEKAVETARKMFSKKYSIDDIAEITDLTLEQVQELQKQLEADPDTPLEKLVEAVAELAEEY